MVRVEFKENLLQVFSEASSDDGVSALVPIDTFLLGFRLHPQGDQKNRWTIGVPPEEEVSGSRDVHLGGMDSRVLNKLSFSWPFSLALRTRNLDRALRSMKSSSGFPSTILHILQNRKGLDFVGEGEWSIFFDFSRIFRQGTSFRFGSATPSDIEEISQARSTFLENREDIEKSKESLVHVLGYVLSISPWTEPYFSYQPSLPTSLTTYNASFPAFQDYHPFSSPGLGFLRRLGEEHERDPGLFSSFSFVRGPSPMMLLEFSESYPSRLGPEVFESPELLSEPKDLSLYVSSRLGISTDSKSLSNSLMEELELLWSLPLGSKSIVGAYPARQVALFSSNPYYWNSIMKFFGSLYDSRPSGKFQLSNSRLSWASQFVVSDSRSSGALQVVVPDIIEASRLPGFEFLKDEELKELVFWASTGGHFLPWYNYVSSRGSHSSIVFSPSLIFDYPNSLDNLRAIYLVPYAIVQFPSGHKYLYFSLLVSFSGRVGVSTFFLGNEVLGFDFLITYSYAKEEDLPYLTLSVANYLEGRDLKVRGRNAREVLSKGGVDLVREQESLWTCSTIYLKRGLLPIPGSRTTVYYLPPVAKVGGEEEIEFGWVDDLLKNLERYLEPTKEKGEPVQEKLIPDPNENRVYSYRIKSLYGEEKGFLGRLTSSLSKALFLIGRKRRDSGNRFSERYLIREGIKQEAFSFPISITRGLIESALSHFSYDHFRRLLGDPPRRVSILDRIYRDSSPMEEAFWYLGILPEDFLEEARNYLLYLSKLLFQEDGEALLSIPKPPERRASLFFLFSEPSFVSGFSVKLMTEGSKITNELYSLEIPFFKERLPSSTSDNMGWRSAFLPPRPLVRYMRVNDMDSDYFATIHVFHHHEVNVYPFNPRHQRNLSWRPQSELYPINDVCSLLL